MKIQPSNFIVFSGLEANHADLDPDYNIFEYSAYKHVDFSVPVIYGQVFIMSSKYMDSGSIFKDAFDGVSSKLILLSFAMYAIMFWIQGWRSPFTSLLNVAGIFLRQEVKIRKVNLNIIFMLLTTTMISTMYNSKIISIMTAKKDVEKIDSLEDLVYKYPNKEIWLAYDYEFLKDSMYYDKLKSRMKVVNLDLTVWGDTVMQVLLDVNKGTHVFVDIDINFSMYYAVYIPDWFACQYPEENIRFSQNVLNLIRGVWVYRKDFALKEYFDKVQVQHIKSLKHKF